MEIYRTNKMQKDWEADIKLYEARIQNLENEFNDKTLSIEQWAISCQP